MHASVWHPPDHSILGSHPCFPLVLFKTSHVVQLRFWSIMANKQRILSLHTFISVHVQRFGGYSHLFSLFVGLDILFGVKVRNCKRWVDHILCPQTLPPKAVKAPSILLMQSYAKVRERSALTVSCSELCNGVTLSFSAQSVFK